MGEHEQANATSEDTQGANEHERYMARALELAARGAGWTNPNPQVGAVIVKDGRIIGEGWHTAYGKLHAEREALAHCTEDPRGRDHLRDARTLLSLGKDAALHGSYHRGGHRARGGGCA